MDEDFTRYCDSCGALTLPSELTTGAIVDACPNYLTVGI